MSIITEILLRGAVELFRVPRLVGDAMKHALKATLLIVLGAVLLAGLHIHAREHEVSHPDAAKVSLSERTVPQPQLPVILAAVAVLAAEHLIAVDVAHPSGVITILEIEESSYHLRGPPVVCPL